MNFFKGMEAGFHWYFVRDNSNINLYNYSRHIAGGQLALPVLTYSEKL